MITDRIAGRLRLFSSNTPSAPQKERVSVPETSGITQKRPLPIEIFRGPKTQLRDSLYIALQTTDTSSGALTPLPDQDERNIFLCDKNEKGDSKFWLPPDKWADTLKEFGDFLEASRVKRLRMEITTHMSGENGGVEWIMARPVVTRDDFWKVRENDYTFGITSDGRVSFGPKRGWYEDLGYLNPKRAALLSLAANRSNSELYEVELRETLASLR